MSPIKRYMFLSKINYGLSWNLMVWLYGSFTFFSYAVFNSACFNLRYRSGLGLLVWDFSNLFRLYPLIMFLSISSFLNWISFFLELVFDGLASIVSNSNFSIFISCGQFVEWFGFPSILTWSTDTFFDLFLIFRCLCFFFRLQYLTVRRWRSQFAVCNARFFWA